MLAILLLPTLLLAQASGAPACSGADPAITKAVSRLVSTDSSGTNHYQLTVTVVNFGASGEPSNALISVDVWQDENKVDEKGLPPLRAGQAYSFNESYVRASDAAMGSTTFRFALDFHQPAISPASDCDTSNDTYKLKF